jgi:hypothetical protein
MTDPQESVDTRLGRMEGKLDVLLDIHKDGLDDHEERLRQLESSKLKMHGTTAALGFITSLIYNIFGGGHR